ncbi:LysR family transcriptional regulator [soil metagenome]
MQIAELLRRLRDVNLNQLSTFLTVAELSSFRRAAEQMHMSQSALSVKVRQLEHALGVPLFHRTTRSVALTAQGETLRDLAQRLYVDLSRVVVGFREEAALPRGLVTMAVLPSLAATLLPPLIKVFIERHPGIDLKLRDTDSQRAIELVRNGEVDMGFLSASRSVEGLVFKPLFDDEFVVVVPATGHVLSRRANVSLKDVAAVPMILNPRGVDLREILERMFAEANLSIAPVQELIGSHSVVAMVSEGMGAAILPKSALRGLDMSRSRVVALRPRASRRIGHVVVPERARVPAVRAFLAFVESRFRSQPE